MPPKMLFVWLVFLGLFFVSCEADVGCLHPVLLAQLVQPRSWGRGSLLCPNQPQDPSKHTELTWWVRGCSIPTNVFRAVKRNIRKL